MVDFLERGVRKFKRVAFRRHRNLFRKLALHGWVYRIHDGGILQLDSRPGEFRPWP